MAVKIVSPRAELAVLRGITSKNKVIAGTLLSSVDESYFDAEESKEIYGAMKQHMSSTGESPTYRLMIEDPDISREARSFFRDSEATIQTIEDALKAVKILNRYRQLRGLHELAVDIDNKMQEGKVDLDVMMEGVSSKIAAIRSAKTSKDAFLHLGKNNNSLGVVKSILYDDASEEVIPTGIPAFDQESGGFSKGSLVTLGASSGGGKSVVANVLAKNMAALGYKVVLVPLEMTKIEMMARTMAAISQLDVTRVLQKRLTENEKAVSLKRMTQWMKKVKARGGRLTYFEPEADLDIEEIYAATNSYDADAVIIDYISLIKGADADDAWQKLGAMARTAKINAKSTKRVNILLCQVSEDGKVRYARSISEHSNNSWVWVTPKAEREKDVGRIRVEQPKSRNSRSFPFDIGIHWSHMNVVPVENQSDVADVAEPGKDKDKQKPRRNLADV
jgi:replicative DNA helicase